MAVKKFKFVSPGVFLKEVDQSQIPRPVAPIGPTIIGRAKRGPALIPIQVNSYSEFVELFGEPIAGGGGSGDGWRDGNYDAPTYAPYAAQAWLANSQTVNFVRLLGVQDDTPTATTSNNAGYAGWKIDAPAAGVAVGAFGLFVFPSASHAVTNISGTLAAIWYCTGSAPILSGTLAGSHTSELTQSNGVMVKADSGKFTVFVSGTAGAGKTDADKKVQFSFDSTSGNFIRKVFNTSPRNCDTGDAGPSSEAGLWLGETFENQFFLNQNSFGSSNAYASGSANLSSNFYGIILPLNNYHDHLQEDGENNAARTGWYFRQSINQGSSENFDPTSQAKLFRFVSIDGGDWIRSNIKIEITNIKPPINEFVKYGTFDVILRSIDDVDNSRNPIESYTGCNLDPSSPNFISRKIGDVKYTYDSAAQKLFRQGTNENVSRYIRVELHSDFDTNVSADALPFGVFGPIRPKTLSGIATTIFDGASTGLIAANGFTVAPAVNSTASLSALTNVKLSFPATLTRVSSSEDGLSNYKQASFGFKSTKSTSSFVYDVGNVDMLRLPAGDLAGFRNGIPSSNYEYSWYFTLDEVVQTGSGSNIAFSYVSGSRTAGSAYTATGGQTYVNLLNTIQLNSFCSPLQGGSDGFNVFEKEPLRNTAIFDGATAQTSYIYNTYKRAIDTIKDPEFIETNVVTIPGLAQESLTLYLLQTVENRADALAIIDISADQNNRASYVTQYELTTGITSEKDRIYDVDDVVSKIKSRNLNTSYGAAYYPWVQVVDDTTGKVVNMPPSVVALGAMSYTDSVQAPWFAPAGFNRGGLSLGNSGLTVVNSVYRLTSQDRDRLYEVNVNPIASFPAEGLVIFGQKTLQAVPSALDRINVRRLMLFVKRGISIISRGILFEPNVEATWNNFVRRVDPFLAEVKSRFGITDFRIVLDSSTTTPDLVDQNIMYAKIFIKPARAIEFIAVDFFITNTGASFAD